MDGFEKEVVRDVRTLLLCRIKEDFLRCYGTIYAPEDSDARTFMTMGGFDAVKIYRTMPASESGKPGWAQHVYNDKENVIGAMDESISYHPIHLVTYAENVETFWGTEQKHYPFFIMTFVYGINSKYGGSRLENSPKSLQKNSTDADAVTSLSEEILVKYLESQQLDKGKVQFAVYHAVNLSDLVILWFTSDIPYILGKVAEIEKDGPARKTYSTVGLPLQNASIPSFADSATKAAKTPVNLRISGTIRDHSIFAFLYKARNASGGLPQVIKNADTFLTYGENDFLIVSKPLSNSDLVSLFRYWLEYAEEWRSACWEVHTDILIPAGDYCSKKAQTEMPSILSDAYKTYQSIYKEKLKNFKWSSTFSELLSVYVNIDRNPVLRGPSYLVEGCIKIANSYFSGEVSGFERGSPAWTSLMSESEASIDRFVRNWSQLTDQVTRIDAVMLHGLGDTVAIHNTLPEFIMDCYHSLMHKLVDLLVMCDQEDGRIEGNGFQYDFLFVPELSQRMRISKVFNTTTKYRPELKKPCVWPAKQAYLMEFPAPYIYQPQTFFLQLAHECFHCFGDTLRLRRKRASSMSLYLAAHFAAGLGYESDAYKELVRAIGVQLHIEDNEVEGELYLEEVVNILQDKLIRLVNQKSISKVQRTDDGFYFLYDEECIMRWGGLEQSFFKATKGSLSLKSILITCKYYFKECYADAMMAAFLQLTPAEYLPLFQDEFAAALLNCSEDAQTIEDIDLDGCFCKNVQRISIVMAACCKAKVWKTADCDQAIDEAFQLTDHERTGMRIAQLNAVRGIQRKTFMALCQQDLPMPDGKWFSPLHALAYVVEYLEKVLAALDNKLRTSEVRHKEFLCSYDSIIRKENLFGKEFYSVMRHEMPGTYPS